MTAPPAGLPACDAIVFDCDGVLVDSENLANEALRSVLAELGWDLGQDECKATFVGKSLPATQELVAAHFAAAGRVVDPAWTSAYKARRDAAIAEHLTLMPGIRPVLDAASARFQSRMAVASNSPRAKLDTQLAITGLDAVFAPAHVFSGMDMAHPKPAPDVYLAAAGSLAPPSRSFAVLEDSPTGIAAAVAAGAFVMGLSTIYPDEELLAAGAALTRHDLAGIADVLRA